MGLVFLHVEIIYPSCERNVHMYLEREVVFLVFFLQGPEWNGVYVPWQPHVSQKSHSPS